MRLSAWIGIWRRREWRNGSNGAAMGDLSGYTLTLQGMEKKPANFLSGGVSGVGITVSTTNIDDI